MSGGWLLVLLSAVVFVMGAMVIVGATEREWQEFGIFCLVVILVICVVGFIDNLRETLER